MKVGSMNGGLLERLHARGYLRDIDFYLAESLGRCYGESDPEARLAAALVSRAVEDGHGCLDLDGYAGQSWPPDSAGGVGAAAAEPVILPELEPWLAKLAKSPLCRGSDSLDTPLELVIDGGRPRLYLRRYYRYEQTVARGLKALAAATLAVEPSPRAEALLEKLFPRAADGAHRDQRAAAEAALARRLLIVSGGPGTGKTYTLARVLAFLIDNRTGGTPPVIRMAAPTGKAAMRMRESIREARQALGDTLAAPVALIGEEACTLHRLLGTRPHSPHFRHNAAAPLPADVVIVDEAGMIALPLMAKLIEALDRHTRLILLGDMRQLASVEPGSVLGDICNAARRGPGTPLDGALIELKHSHRFSAGGPVDRLSAALRAAGTAADPGAERAWKLLRELPGQSGGGQVELIEPAGTLRDAGKRPVAALRRIVLEEYREFMEATAVPEIFRALGRFRILCALRQGPYGVGELNRIVEEILAFKDVPPRSGRTLPARRLQPEQPYYDHRVIIITRNDYALGLFNGDVGVILAETAGRESSGGAQTGKTAAWFEAGERSEGYRKIACHMLPAHETAFAMTVHKSQGSQFRNVLMVLPDRDNPVLTRELLYTGITRCERKVRLWCPEIVFKQAAGRRTRRSSGLENALSS